MGGILPLSPLTHIEMAEAKAGRTRADACGCENDIVCAITDRYSGVVYVLSKTAAQHNSGGIPVPPTECVKNKFIDFHFAICPCANSLFMRRPSQFSCNQMSQP